MNVYHLNPGDQVIWKKIDKSTKIPPQLIPAMVLLVTQKSVKILVMNRAGETLERCVPHKQILKWRKNAD